MTPPGTETENTLANAQEGTEGARSEAHRTLDGGHDPAEMGRRSGEARRRRRDERAAEPDARIAIASALEAKARKGDVNAAREYREWLAMREDELRGDAWMEALSARERLFVRRVIDRALDRAGIAPSG